MLVMSANDAAVTLAVGVAGSERAFVRLMNRRAGQLGLTHTHFMNSRGEDQARHFMSARDLATLANYVWTKYAFFRDTVATRTAVVTWPPSHRVTVTSHNRLLDYKWGDGIKTGATRRAGKVLVGSGTPGGVPLHRRHHARADARPGGEGRRRAARVGRGTVTARPVAAARRAAVRGVAAAVLVSAAAVLLLALAGCGGSSDKPGASGTTPPTVQAPDRHPHRARPAARCSGARTRTANCRRRRAPRS